MTILQRSAIILALPVVACTQGDPRPSSERQGQAQPGAVASQAESSTVIGRYGGDSVVLIRGEEFNAMVWHRADVARPWRVDSLLSAEPSVRLAMIDRDSVPDLFFTIRWEEFILGEVWLARGDSAVRAFSSANDACRIPELRDVNSDGLLDAIDWRAGALLAEECTGNVLAQACQEEYTTEWPEVWLQSHDGNFKRDSVGARTFYRDMAVRFADGARDLRSKRAASDGRPSKLDRCNDQVAASLEAMGRRADAISRLGM